MVRFYMYKRKGEIEMAVKENEKIAKASQEWEYLRGDEACLLYTSRCV